MLPLSFNRPEQQADRCSWLKPVFLFVVFVFTMTAGVSFSFADTLLLSGESVSGSWRQGLTFTGVDFGSITLQANASSAPVLVGYLNADPSRWYLGEEDFFDVGVHYTVNGVAPAQSTLFDSQPEVLCLTQTCSDSTPDEWAIDTYLNTGLIRTSSGEIIPSLLQQGIFAGGNMLIPASNGAEQYPVYYSFTLIPEPAAITLMLAGIAVILTITVRKRLLHPSKTTVR